MRDWLDPLFDAAEMRAADAWAIEDQGVPSLDLMERAGVGLAVVTAAAARPGPVRVVVGKGNNGGDGLVVARLLRSDGHQVDVLTAGSLDEPRAGAIAAINDQEAPVVACDVPSGVDASSGEVEGDAVRATVTATFHGPKIGLHVAPGALHAGEVRTVAIGIPRDAPSAERAGLISARALELVPSRTRASTKFDAGTLVVAGGMRGLTGAPTMAALAAMRTGAGYVQ